MTVERLQSSFGIVNINENNVITDFNEKPLLNEWINIGFMVIEKSFFNMFDNLTGMVDLYKKAILTKRYFAFKHEGEHLTVNTKEEKKETELKLRGFYTILNNLMGEHYEK